MICTIGVPDVNIQKRGHALSSSRLAYHDLRVTDIHHRRPIGLKFPGGRKDSLQEGDQSGCVSSDNSRRDGLPTIRYEAQDRLQRLRMPNNLRSLWASEGRVGAR